MTGIQNVGKIQINEDIPFQKKEWRAQRIGWAALLLIVALALMGVFGRGPVARESAGDAATFGVEFEKIVRHAASSELTVHVGPGLQQDSTLQILIAREYIDKFDINEITPEPLRRALRGEFIAFDFERKDARVPARIIFEMTAREYWGQQARVSIAGATTLTFGQFVLP